MHAHSKSLSDVKMRYPQNYLNKDMYSTNSLLLSTNPGTSVKFKY